MTKVSHLLCGFFGSVVLFAAAMLIHTQTVESKNAAAADHSAAARLVHNRRRWSRQGPQTRHAHHMSRNKTWSCPRDQSRRTRPLPQATRREIASSPRGRDCTVLRTGCSHLGAVSQVNVVSDSRRAPPSSARRMSATNLNGSIPASVPGRSVSLVPRYIKYPFHS